MLVTLMVSISTFNYGVAYISRLNVQWFHI